MGDQIKVLGPTWFPTDPEDGVPTGYWSVQTPGRGTQRASVLLYHSPGWGPLGTEEHSEYLLGTP